MNTYNYNWDAVNFFEQLTDENLLAREEKFTFCRVSGLDGFEEALETMQSSVAFVCVSDIAGGYTELNNTPRTRRVKTVFLAMRHALNDMTARQECMDTMRELFRQFMSKLILEKTKLEQHCIYLDPRITFTEIDRYFASGCACAYFQIAVDVFTDLRYNSTEWNSYDLWLVNFGPDKLDVIHVVKELLGLGLKEAKELVDQCPVVLVKNVDSDTYRSFEQKINAVNGKVELRQTVD